MERVWYDEEKTMSISERYENNKGERIILGQSVLCAGISKQTEGAIVRNIEINGYNAIWYTNLGLDGISWTDNEYSFSVDYDNLTDEDLIKITNNIIIYE